MTTTTSPSRPPLHQGDTIQALFRRAFHVTLTDLNRLSFTRLSLQQIAQQAIDKTGQYETPQYATVAEPAAVDGAVTVLQIDGRIGAFGRPTLRTAYCLDLGDIRAMYIHDH
jgi:hypothetical protein